MGNTDEGGVGYKPGVHPPIQFPSPDEIAPHYDAYSEPEASARPSEQGWARVDCPPALERARERMTDLPLTKDVYGDGADLLIAAQRNDGDQPGPSNNIDAAEKVPPDLHTG